MSYSEVIKLKDGNFTSNNKFDLGFGISIDSVQTINIFANDSVELSATYKVNENISVKNYFSISLNKFLAAVLIVDTVVAFPVIASSFAAAGPLLAQYAAGLLTAGVTGGALVFS